MKNKNFAHAYLNAWAGIKHAAVNERNFKIHLAAAVLAVGACIFFKADSRQIINVVFAIFLVLCMELVNTAVEAAVDLICGNKTHPLAKIAKDAAAGAVLLAAVNALVTAAVTAWEIIKG